ncbi:hypothetical protein A0H81_09082 [Grifola frondosa]|uniref:GH18 domain-containing protein n=1 Tax=Grifola frondosa TaxID=5627 RepID=A0A1C7M1S0_GRIFR|nr:hypothetical protein A0H81_09082 [Grifola frondosa]
MQFESRLCGFFAPVLFFRIPPPGLRMFALAMSFFSIFFWMLTSLTLVLCAPVVVAAPIAASTESPAFVIYTNSFISADVLPPVADLQGYNVVVLSFLLLNGPFDQAAAWAALSLSQRASTKSDYANADIRIIVSAFGSTEEPTTSGVDPVRTANNMAQFVLENSLDGIDVDYEVINRYILSFLQLICTSGLEAMNKGDGAAEAWLVSFTRALREQLPQGQFILTHAPVAPWFSTNSLYTKSGAYRTVHKEAGNLIDWYNIQFYNQGANEYTDCDSLLTASGGNFPESSIFEIATAGIPLNKLVIGKLGAAANGTTGFMHPQTLGVCVAQAEAQTWNAGIMAFEYPEADASWIKAARGSSFPQFS